MMSSQLSSAWREAGPIYYTELLLDQSEVRISHMMCQFVIKLYIIIKVKPHVTAQWTTSSHPHSTRTSMEPTGSEKIKDLIRWGHMVDRKGRGFCSLMLCSDKTNFDTVKWFLKFLSTQNDSGTVSMTQRLSRAETCELRGKLWK